MVLGIPKKKTVSLLNKLIELAIDKNDKDAEMMR